MSLLLLLIGCGPPATPTDSGPVDSATDTAVDTADTAVDEAVPWPATLAATGLYTDLESGTLAPGVRRYTPAWPLWSDGASKDRYVAFPDGATIDATDPDAWQFPVGTKAWKTFEKDGVRVETRYIERTEADWVWVSYLWRADGTDADPVPDGLRDATGTPHDVPGTDACLECHRATGLLGIGAVQLGDDNADATLQSWTEEGLVVPPVTASTAVPGDGVVREALGYMHGNCGSCHIDDSGPPADLELRMHAVTGADAPEHMPVYQTAFGTPTHHQLQTSVVITPGDPDASQVVERMEQRGLLGMPPVGSEVVDDAALEAVRAWIEGLPAR